MRQLVHLFMLVALVQPFFAQADIQMASPKLNKMVKTCSVQGDPVADAACQVFLVAVVDTTAFYSTAQQLTRPFCIPSGLSTDELVAVYRAYLDEHHALRQFSAAALAVSAFKNAFPCE